jgi:hypothetical protein
VRKDREVVESGVRRIRKNILSRKIGTTYTIHHGQTTTKNTNTVKRRSERSQSGKIGYMRIAGPGKLPVMLIVTKTFTDLR